jgi:hypothetical protein
LIARAIAEAISRQRHRRMLAVSNRLCGAVHHNPPKIAQIDVVTARHARFSSDKRFNTINF